MNLLLVYLPAFFVIVALTLAERLRGAPRADWWRNLQAWALYAAVAVLLIPLVRDWQGPALFDGAKLPFWLAFAIFIIVKDFGEYAAHRAQHTVPFLWAMHSLHHSDPEMAALTTQRHFWGDQLLKQVTIWPAALMVIRPTTGMFALFGVCSLWNYVAHTDLRIDFGRLSWLLNTPAYHRRHHSLQPEHYNRNFAALFPIFDVLFGSYHRPDGWPPTGLDRKPERFSELLIWPLIWNRAPRPADEAAALNPR